MDVISETKKVQTDLCVICSKDTGIPKTTDISYRNFYVEGAGQLCGDCWDKVYGNK